MAKYSAPCFGTMSATATLALLMSPSSGPRRSKTIDILAGVDGTPGDTAVRLQFQRCTLGSVAYTSVNVVSLDGADAATTMIGGRACTVEPTYTANTIFLQMVFNQRSTVRWFAAPGEEIVTPASTSTGYGVLPAVSPSLSAYVNLIFEE